MLKIRRKLVSTLACIALFSTTILTACSGAQSSVSKSDFYFNTVISITLYGTNDISYINDCFTIAKKYENMLSNTVEGSDIYEINTHPFEFVTVNSETLELLQLAILYGNLSDGRFDVTIGGIADMWNFSEVSANTNEEHNAVDTSKIPNKELLEEAVSCVSYEKIIIDQNKVSLYDASLKIDLGAIAKGYIADQMKAYLNAKGITSGIINLGGNILTIGPKADGNPYTIGLQKPFGNQGEALVKLKVSDSSVVTSGIYERYFTVDGKLYHHILDAKTGYPVENNLNSVTIISKDSVIGDVLSTYFYIIGYEEALAYLSEHNDIQAIFITKDNEILASPGLTENIDYILQ